MIVHSKFACTSGSILSLVDLSTITHVLCVVEIARGESDGIACFLLLVCFLATFLVHEWYYA